MSVSGFVLKSGVKLGHATVRGGASLAYGIGGDLERGWDAACEEHERQSVKTQAHFDKLNSERETRIAAAKARHAAAQAAAQAASVAVAAPMAAAA